MKWKEQYEEGPSAITIMSSLSTFFYRPGVHASPSMYTSSNFLEFFNFSRPNHLSNIVFLNDLRYENERTRKWSFKDDFRFTEVLYLVDLALDSRFASCF